MTDHGTRFAADMFDADTASRALGIELLDLGPGWARMRMAVTDAMVNGHRIAHGGYVFLLADTAFALACNTVGTATVAAGADVSFVRPARAGETLVADARERVRYGKSGIYDVTVSTVDGETVAEFRGRSRTVGDAPR